MMKKSLFISTVTVTSTYGGAHLVPVGAVFAVLKKGQTSPRSSGGRNVFVYLKTVNTKNTGGVQATVSAGVGRLAYLEHFPTLSLWGVQGGQLLEHLLRVSVTKKLFKNLKEVFVDFIIFNVIIRFLIVHRGNWTEYLGNLLSPPFSKVQAG